MITQIWRKRFKKLSLVRISKIIGSSSALTLFLRRYLLKIMLIFSQRTNGEMSQKKIRAKDEFDHATDWTRKYIEIYNRLKWLNAFA